MNEPPFGVTDYPSEGEIREMFDLKSLNVDLSRKPGWEYQRVQLPEQAKWLQEQLRNGWEPFAVTSTNKGDAIHLRRKKLVYAAEKAPGEDPVRPEPES